MHRERLDSKGKMPSGMEDYLSIYGWHFSKKLCEWAVSNMKKKSANGQLEKLPMIKKDTLEESFKKYNITIDNNVGYDHVYVYHMAKADFYGTSLLDEHRVLQYVKDYIDDPDGYDGLPMTRFYADCIGSGNPIIWEDML